MLTVMWSMVIFSKFVWTVFLLLMQFRHGAAWHGFSNTKYHCWQLSASVTTPTPLPSCEGVSIRWIVSPPDIIKANSPFNVTYEMILLDAFYPWAYSNGLFTGAGTGSVITDATTAKDWCKNTVCPTDPALGAKDNCCVHHVNVHSCSLASVSLCGPWIKANGTTYTHSNVKIGPVDQGNWTTKINGLYEIGDTSLIAHFKIANMHLALEHLVKVLPRTVCGDDLCETSENEDCSTCPKDCGSCPLELGAILGIAAAALVVVVILVSVVAYFQWQKRKLLYDESWIKQYSDIKDDVGFKGLFGSAVSVDVSSMRSSADMRGNTGLAVHNRQIFTAIGFVDGQRVAIRMINKKVMQLTQAIRIEVRQRRELEHTNLCKFVGGCIEVPNVCVLTEYCAKGSLNDILLNETVPISWAFRFSFATDIARGMTYLHGNKVYHGHLKSQNCVIDDRWTVKVTDFDLNTYMKEEVAINIDEQNERNNMNRRACVYHAPEIKHQAFPVITAAVDVYAFGVILIEIATRNDPFGDEDVFALPDDWKPPLPELYVKDPDMQCPCPEALTQLIADCYADSAHTRPLFDGIKKTLQKINPSKLSPVDLMMNMMEKYSKHLEIIVSERTQDLVNEKQKTDRLLYSMLPQAVADKLRHGQNISAENYGACTIFFSDIVGFTTISGSSTPIEVVVMLNQLYTCFDTIIDLYNVYKVETIGDAYMVVSGVPQVTEFHSREIANMALDLVKACETFVIPHKPKESLKIRVGLHSGPVCAGVVGQKMPRYCLFGDTVNTASRMESNGEAYKIHISNSTYIHLTKIGGYRLDHRGVIPIKGKGDMKTYWLTGRDIVKTDTSNVGGQDGGTQAVRGTLPGEVT